MFSESKKDLNKHLLTSGSNSLTSIALMSNHLREELATSYQNCKPCEAVTNSNDQCYTAQSEHIMNCVSSDVTSACSFDYFDPWRPDTNVYKDGLGSISGQNSVISFLKKTELSSKESTSITSENILNGVLRQILHEEDENYNKNVGIQDLINSDYQTLPAQQETVNYLFNNSAIYNCKQTSISKVLNNNEDKTHIRSAYQLSERSLSTPSLAERYHLFGEGESPEAPRRRIFTYPGDYMPLANSPNEFNSNKKLVSSLTPDKPHLNEKSYEPSSNRRITLNYPNHTVVNNEVISEVQHVSPLFYVQTNVPLPAHEILYDSINCQQSTNLNLEPSNQTLYTSASHFVPYNLARFPFQEESQTNIKHFKTLESINICNNTEPANKNINNSFCIRNLSSDLYFRFQDISVSPFSYFESPLMAYVPPKSIDTSAVDWTSILNKFESLVINESPIVLRKERKYKYESHKNNKKKRVSNQEQIKGKNNNSGCKFCKSNCERKEMYSSHQLKQRLGNRTVISCPVLRRLVCERCGSSGDNAHTKSYCPLEISEKGRKPLSVAIEIKKTKRFASGKIRKHDY